MKKIFLLAVILSSSMALAGESEPLVFGDYLGKIYGDGSGYLGKRFDPNVTMSCKTANCEYDRKKADANSTFDDQWSFHIKTDEMTDEQIITVKKYAYKISEEFGEMRMKTSISLWLNLTDKNIELLCVSGHDYPDMTGMIRVDKNDPIKTNNNGCLLLTKSLDSQLRSGSEITIRGSKFPYPGPETQKIDLGGYGEISDFLRSKRDLK